jgi:hypothetical protein
MSARPQREKKPITTLASNQGRNAAKAAALAAARAAARPKKPKTVTPKGKNIQPQPKRKLEAKNAQSRVLTILDELSKGKNPKVYNMLYSIYRDASSTLFNRLELDDNALIASIEEQYKVVNANIRQSGGETNTLSLDLKTLDDKLNFCLLMWLDMSHDGTVGTNFENFVKSSIVNTFLGETISYKKDTEMMSRMKRLGIITTTKKKMNGRKVIGVLEGLWPGSDFERKIKVNLPFIFGVKEPITTLAVGPKLSNSAINKENKPIYVTLDSESEFKSISTLIDNAKYTFPITKNGERQVIDRYYLKPIITLANRVDPGRLMPIKGVTEEFSKLMQKADKLKSTQLYNVKDCDFKLGKTSLTLDTVGRGKFNLKINGNEIPYGITAGEAKKASNDRDKLSKFLGDFMQILTVLSKPVNQRMVLGTLDGVMCGMCCFLSKSLMKEEPRIFIDMSFKQRNQIVMYGVSDLFKIGKNEKVKPHVSTVGSNFISNNNNTTEVSSGNNRTEGGGNTNNNQNIRNSPSVSRNSTTRNNGGNVPMRNANNTVSIAGSSQGSVSINNNKNNMNSNSQRPPKRARNNNNNVNQPPAKRVNVSRNNTVSVAGSNQKANTRNRLIKNLKNKGLSNNAINRFVKSYNNGTKGVNQILQEVKTNTKRQQNAKNAAALRELKRLRPELFK